MATTYYVSPEGSNSNNGLGPDASHATNKPWLTVDYAMSTATTVGDTVYIAPGVYREVCVNDASGSSGNPISFIGDPRNEQGFKNSSGVLRRRGLRRLPLIRLMMTRRQRGLLCLLILKIG